MFSIIQPSYFANISTCYQTYFLNLYLSFGSIGCQEFGRFYLWKKIILSTAFLQVLCLYCKIPCRGCSQQRKCLNYGKVSGKKDIHLLNFINNIPIFSERHNSSCNSAIFKL